jgi:hypothetical protein
MVMNQVAQKRNKAKLAILGAAVGTGLVILKPTPDIEIAKQVFMTIANVAMCIMIWNIYFEEELVKKSIQSILSEFFIITLSSIFTAYVLAKATTAAMNYSTHAIGSMGWGMAGILAALATGLLGFGWTCYCDDWYRNSSSPK